MSRSKRQHDDGHGKKDKELSNKEETDTEGLFKRTMESVLRKIFEVKPTQTDAASQGTANFWKYGMVWYLRVLDGEAVRAHA